MNQYSIPKKYQILDGNFLKIFACITMLLDHIAVCLIKRTFYLGCLYFYYPVRVEDLRNAFYVLCMIGRAAFPIFAFLLVEGFLHTRSRVKYALRLLILGIISEIPFNLCLYGALIHPVHNNVCFTLLFGLLAIWSWERFKDRWYIRFPVCALMFVAARQLHTDYRWRGVLLIFIFYLLNRWRVPQVLLGLISMYWKFPAVMIGFVPLLFYNGRRGRQLKYLFYLFYPGHLMILYIIARFLLNSHWPFGIQ